MRKVRRADSIKTHEARTRVSPLGDTVGGAEGDGDDDNDGVWGGGGWSATSSHVRWSARA